MFNNENLHALTNAGNNGGNFYFYFNSGADTVTTSGYFKDVRLAVGDVILCYNGSALNSYKVTARVGNDKTVTLIATDTKAVWGSITGTLSSQTDLNTALGGKLGTAHNTDADAHATLFSGKFDKPTAPTVEGTYTLKATVAEGGAVTYTWVADE